MKKCFLRAVSTFELHKIKIKWKKKIKIEIVIIIFHTNERNVTWLESKMHMHVEQA
jgi:hypothetical protein